MSDQTENVIIIGGGWAGLACAVELAHAGRAVTLIESARQLGGRARCVRFGETRVDNGQHIMVGAYRNLLRLLQRLDIRETTVLQRSPLALELVSLAGHGFHLQTPGLPPPLHLLAGLLTAKGLSLTDRLAALRFGRFLQSVIPAEQEDISVQALLVSRKQTPNLIHCLWEPLCLAALNTPIQTASARIFLRVLQQTFNRQREDSDLLLPVVDLGSTLPEPALDYIECNGGKVLLNRRATDLRITNGAVSGVALDHDFMAAPTVVVATDPVNCQRLLSPHETFTPVVRRLAQLEYQPITTVYLRYPEDVTLRRPMLGVVQGTAQWIFDRTLTGQRGCIAVVISAEGPHMAMDNVALTQLIADELAQLFPSWPEPGDTLVIREKRATFACSVNVDALRPSPQTPVQGLWLAGDFTNTGLPATLEGAVTSGQRCAAGILGQHGLNPPK